MIQLVIFDMDGVIFEGRNFWLDLHRAMGTEQEARRLWRELGQSDYVRLSQFTVEHLWNRRPADHFWRLVHNRQLVTGISTVFAYLRTSGIKSAIVSTGPYQLAERAQELHGINLIRANRVEIDTDGKFTGKVEVQVDENRKDVVAKEIMKTLNIPPAATAMVGDTKSDAAIAKVVSFPIAYNAEDELLRKNCVAHLTAGHICDLIAILNNSPSAPLRRCFGVSST